MIASVPDAAPTVPPVDPLRQFPVHKRCPRGQELPGAASYQVIAVVEDAPRVHAQSETLFGKTKQGQEPLGYALLGEHPPLRDDPAHCVKEP